MLQLAHRLGAPLEHVSRVGRRAALEQAEPQYCLVERRQTREPADERCALSGLERSCLRAGLTRLERVEIRVGPVDATLPPPAVAEYVLRDRDQVRPERAGLVAVVGQAAEGAQEDLLRHVLRLLPRPYLCDDEPVDGRPLRATELLERPAVTPLRALQDRRVGNAARLDPDVPQWTTAQT
jgi:hypothetical protein